MLDSYNPTGFNVGHSIFPGFNDKCGLMICGYEWGYSAKDEELENDAERYAAVQAHLASIQTFHSKAWDSPYDRRILKWFSMFGHPLGEEDGFSAFDKSVLQTNWCDDQGNYVSDYEKFLADANVSNFLGLLREYRPALLIFMGIRQLEYLQNDHIKAELLALFGDEIAPPRFERKDGLGGMAFRVGFQQFERLSIVALPHPSGSRGLSDQYMAQFADEIGERISAFKRSRGLDNAPVAPVEAV